MAAAPRPAAAAINLAMATVAVATALLATLSADCAAAAIPANATCRVYLCKYGYFSNFNCYCPESPMSVYAYSQPSNYNANSSNQSCNASHVSQAIVAFQQAYGLPVTAQCDVETQRAMLSPRCGVADDHVTLRGSPSLSAGTSTSLTAAALPALSADGGGNSATSRQSPSEIGRLLMKRAAEASASVASSVVSAADSAKPVRRTSIAVVDKEAPGRLKTVYSGRRLGVGSAPPAAADSAEGRSQRSASESAEAVAAGSLAHARQIFETDEDRLQRYWEEIRKMYAANGTVPQPAAAATAAAAADAHIRKRRSTIIGSGAFTFTKPNLKWRIVNYSPNLPNADQNAAMDAAFRQWASVTPLCFANDQVSDISTIDILIGFYAGSHPGDARAFDGPGGELAHSSPGVFTHLDSTEQWYTGTAVQTGVALSAVALHEFGHIIGLPHSSVPTSVMYSLYVSSTPGQLLTSADRDAALATYGPCSGSFDAAVDVQFNQQTLDDLGNLVTVRYFSSYFFRSSSNWLYMNSLGRPSDYEPQTIASYWIGVPNNVDAAFQYSGNGVDQVFFLKGSTVYLYSYSTPPVGVTASYAISTFFPSGSLGEPIPNNIDSAYFDPRDGNIYFFKGSFVYVYHYVPNGVHSCCVAKASIASRFPLAPGQPAAVGGVTYQLNVDVVYQAVANNSLYFFVGNHVWVNTAFDADVSQSGNSISYLGTWNNYWTFICDVFC